MQDRKDDVAGEGTQPLSVDFVDDLTSNPIPRRDERGRDARRTIERDRTLGIWSATKDEDRNF